MTAALATLEGLDIQKQTAVLRQAQAAVADASAFDAVSAAEQARMVREWIKVIKGSAALAIEATRLECLALRRVGQVGAHRELPSHKRSVARLFSELSDADFDLLVMAEIKARSTAIGIARQIERERAWRINREAGRAIAGGEPGQIVPVTDDQLQNLVEAAGAMLNTYAADGVPFAVTDAAAAIAEDLGYDQHSAAVREGLREAIRQAIRIDDGGEGCSDDPDAPAWVTYHEDDAGGWVRISWANASLDQFSAMVDLRHSQATQAADTYARLHGVLQRLRRAQALHPTVTSCSKLDRLVIGAEYGTQAS